MCEANAYLLVDGERQPLLDAVDEIEIEGDEVRLVNIFGEQRILKARFLSYSGKERAILFERLKRS